MLLLSIIIHIIIFVEEEDIHNEEGGDDSDNDDNVPYDNNNIPYDNHNGEEEEDYTTGITQPGGSFFSPSGVFPTEDDGAVDTAMAMVSDDWLDALVVTAYCMHNLVYCAF